MIRGAVRRVVAFFTSAALAFWLLVFLAAWSAVATMLPQSDVSGTQVSAWAAAHPFLEPVVRVLGLHQAFTSLIFLAGVFVLSASTALCAWRRTKVAVGRARRLRAAARADAASVVANHDLEVPCAPGLQGPAVLSAVADALERLGVKTHRSGDVLSSVSPSWSVWGSTVFHWGLVAFALVVLVGGLQRSDGLIGVAVGQTKADTPASYGVLHSGPLHDWGSEHRSLRVDAFDPDLRIGNVDYGAAPTVSVLGADGRVIKTQRVYPNAPLRIGSLTVHSPAYGLSATVSLEDTTGAETGRSLQLIDFSNGVSGGTTSSGYLVVSDVAGNPELRISVTIPLDRAGGQYVQALPALPTARVIATTADGRTVVDRVVGLDGTVTLPVGGDLRLDGVGYYARLSVVDDWTIPALYAVLAVALLGLTLTALARQQLVLATVTAGPDGTRLALKIRLWRNAPTTRSEIADELVRALAGDEEKSS